MGRILHAQQEGWELNGAKLLPVKNHGAEGKEDGDSGGLLSRSQCCLVPYLCAAGLGDGDVPPTSVPRAPGVEGHQGPQGLHRPLPWKKKKKNTTRYMGLQGQRGAGDSPVLCQAYLC